MDTTFINNYIWIFVGLAIWELAWKGVSLWRASKNDQKKWFIALFILNTAGILPILYLIFFSKEKKG